MLHIKINLNHPLTEIIEQSATVIRQGGVVLYPTDTIYGLGCDPWNEKALRRIFKMKRRPRGKGILLLIADPNWVNQVAREVPPTLRGLAARLWPGPVTFLVPAHPDLPALVVGEEGKVGIRQPNVPFLQIWMATIPGPVVSTSANVSGQSPPDSLRQLKERFLDEVDLFLEGPEISPAPASTVIDLCDDPPRLVRRGANMELIEPLLESLH